MYVWFFPSPGQNPGQNHGQKSSQDSGVNLTIGGEGHIRCVHVYVCHSMCTSYLNGFSKCKTCDSLKKATMLGNFADKPYQNKVRIEHERDLGGRGSGGWGWQIPSLFYPDFIFRGFVHEIIQNGLDLLSCVAGNLIHKTKQTTRGKSTGKNISGGLPCIYRLNLFPRVEISMLAGSKPRVGSGSGFGGGSGGPGGGFFSVLSVMALPLFLLLSRNHRQDHQNHHQDHKNLYQNPFGVSPLGVYSRPTRGK